MQEKPQTELGKILGFDPPGTGSQPCLPSAELQLKVKVRKSQPPGGSAPKFSDPPKATLQPVYPLLPELPCRILGFDPGFALLGFALLDVEKTTIELIDCGVIETYRHTQTYPERLWTVMDDAEQLILKHSPKLMVVEKFFTRNLGKNATAVAQARGILVMLAGKHKLPLYEPNPVLVKQRIHGFAGATKKQMQTAVSEILGIDYLIEPDDAADAVGNSLLGAWDLQHGVLEANQPL